MLDSLLVLTLSGLVPGENDFWSKTLSRMRETH